MLCDMAFEMRKNAEKINGIRSCGDDEVVGIRVKSFKLTLLVNDNDLTPSLPVARLSLNLDHLVLKCNNKQYMLSPWVTISTGIVI